MAGANIKIGANSSDFQKKMQDVTRQLKVTQSEFKLASESAKLFGNSTDQLKSKQGELENKLKGQNTILKMQQNGIKNITKDIKAYKDVNESLARKIKETEKEQKEAVKTYGKGSTEVKELNEKLKTLKEQYAKNEKAIESSNKKIDNQKIKMNEAKIAIEKTKKAIEDNSKALEKMGDKFAKVGEKAGKISDKMKPISVGIIGLGTLASKKAIDFEDSMAKVSTIADTTKVPLNNLKEGILDLSNQTGISSAEIANNVYDSISAGQKTGDAINFVRESTKLANAGFAEAGQSLDLVTTILNSYGLQASEVTKISDILIQTQNLGKVTVGELSTVMGKVIPTAKSLGVNFAQVASGYAIMTAKGVKSAETTTYMNSMLNELGKSGTVASKALKSATGKTFPELIKSGKSVGDVLNIMDGYAKKNKKSLSDMFGSAEAGKAALLLSENSGKDFNSMLDQMNKSSGATQKAFDKTSGTIKFKLKEALTQGQNALIGFGDVLAPFISLGATALSTVTQGFNNLSKSQKEFIVGAGSLFVATNVILGVFSTFAKNIKGTIKIFKDFPKGIKKTGEAIKGLPGKFKSGITGIKSFGKSLKSGIRSIGRFSKSILKISWKGITKGVSLANKGIKLFAKGLLSGIKGVGKFSKSILKIGWKGITKGASLATKGIKGLGKGLLTGVKAVGKFTLSLAKMIVQLTISGTKFAFNTAKLLAQKVAMIATTVATKAMELAQGALNLIMSLNPITIIIGLLVALGATFVILYNKCEWFRNGVNAVWNGIKSVFSSFANFLKGAFSTDWTQSLGLLGVPLNCLFSVIGSIWSGVKGVFSGILEFLKGVFTGNWHMIFSGLGNIVKSVFGALGGIIKAPINAAISGINWVVSKVNCLSFDVPDWVPGVGGKHFGINLPSIPALAEGGIVTKSTLALIGEGKEHEAVIPLSKLDKLVTNSVQKVLSNKKTSRNDKQEIYIIKNYLDSEEISNYTYRKVGNKLAMAGRRR